MTHDIDADAAAAPGQPQPLTLHTLDGLALEAEITIPENPVAAVVLAHPNPQQGGSMRSIIISELFRTLPSRDIAVIRFNYRGIGESEGSYGEGRGERNDIAAAIDELHGRLPDRTLVLAGWSFGGDVSLSVLDDRLAGWFLIAPPLRVLPFEELVAAHDPRPKHFAVPEHDEFRKPDALREATEGWENITIDVVAGADHYCIGRTNKVADYLVGFIDELRA